MLGLKAINLILTVSKLANSTVFSFCIWNCFKTFMVTMFWQVAVLLILLNVLVSSGLHFYKFRNLAKKCNFILHEFKQGHNAPEACHKILHTMSDRRFVNSCTCQRWFVKFHSSSTYAPRIRQKMPQKTLNYWPRSAVWLNWGRFHSDHVEVSTRT